MRDQNLVLVPRAITEGSWEPSAGPAERRRRRRRRRRRGPWWHARVRACHSDGMVDTRVHMWSLISKEYEAVCLTSGP